MLFELLSARIHHLEVMIEVNVFRYLIVDDTDFIQKILRKHIRLRLRNDLLDGVFDRLKSVINPHVLFVNLEFGDRFERLCRFFPRPVRQSVTDIRIKIFQNEIDRRETLLPVDNFVYLISFMKGNQRADIIVLLFRRHCVVHVLNKRRNLILFPRIISLIDGDFVSGLFAVIQLADGYLLERQFFRLHITRSPSKIDTCGNSTDKIRMFPLPFFQSALP